MYLRGDMGISGPIHRKSNIKFPEEKKDEQSRETDFFVLVSSK